MPSRLVSAENFQPGSPSTKFLVSGKNRDYYVSKYGPGFSGTEINPAGITTEPGNGYRYHVYLSPTTINVVGRPLTIEYLVVAGGGAGGGHWSPTPATGSRGSGGGGSGGMRTGTEDITPGSYPIVVGPGGPGGQFNGGDGSNSQLGSIVSAGGGGGGMAYWTGPPPAIGPTLFWCLGRSGGSGGGGGAIPSPDPNGNPSNWFAGGAGNTPPTTPPQGNPGGNGGVGLGGGGGGGSGGSGTSAPSGTAGIGRTDIRFAAPLIAPAIPAPLRPTWITAVGDLGTYASGGTGNLATAPQGFLTGGGGAGGGNPGHAYTGGGGAGYGPRPGPHGGFPGGNGGSGLVVFRYLI